uniref:Glutathione transferase n=1 Tax=Spongospora subterranea TaxID=70186 RepID=A0A0H5RJN7_9EUKA|eukprot:CRZ08919.1 hypothetical protein [Spongospora subterranea]
MMVSIDPEFGYVIAVLIAFYVQQNVIFVAFVVKARMKTKIKAPTLYPRDSEVKALKLTEDNVDYYLRAQRIHQNNIEFMSMFLPVFLMAGIANPIQTAIAGAVVWTFRMAFALGYSKSTGSRSIGAPFHLGELYILYIAGKFAYQLLVDGGGK